VFIHPALYYDITAAAYALMFAAARVLGIGGAASTPVELLVFDQRYFIYTARAVSLLSAVWALGLLRHIGKSLWSSTAGWAAAALLALLPLHVTYAKTVRVDALFAALFVYAGWCVVRLLDDHSRRAQVKAALAVGLATGANYNGGVLVLWLVAAVWHRGGTGRGLLGALFLTALAFVSVNPYVLLDFPSFAAHFTYQAGLAATTHPGWEERGALYYVDDLLRVSLPLAVLIALAIASFAVFGNRRERFLLSQPVVYFALFSVMRTRDDRFVLPALAMFMLFAGGLPTLVGRRLGGWPRVAGLLAVLAYGGIGAALATMAPEALTVPQPMAHVVRPRYSAGILDWIETHVHGRAAILVESGIAPMLDTTMEDGRFGAALRRALVTQRPRLDHDFRKAVFVGGCNYDAGVVQRGEIDYAIIALRNRGYIERHCDEFPTVCDFYTALSASGEVVFATPEGFEPLAVFALRR
jgi:4-amino-4-deoxy-L-arabinose transferase-like glycosyltransferase